MTTNQCKACGDTWTAEHHETRHACGAARLAARYGGSERTYRNVYGHVDGWHEWRPCSVCGSRDVVAVRAVKLQDRVWCAQHVGKNKGHLRSNPFAVFVTACMKGNR